MEIFICALVAIILTAVSIWWGDRQVKKDIELRKMLHEAELIGKQEIEDEKHERVLKTAAFKQFIAWRSAQKLARLKPGFVPVTICYFSISGPCIYYLHHSKTSKFGGPDSQKIKKQIFDTEFLRLKNEHNQLHPALKP